MPFDYFDQAPDSSSKFEYLDDKPSSISDIPKNAVSDTENIVKGMGDLVKGPALDIASGDVASALPKLMKTTPGQAAESLIKPVENLGSGQEWIKHPVQNTLTAASMVLPVIGGVTDAIKAPEPTGDPNLLQRMGAGARNNATGISTDTIERVAKGGNPVKAGVNLANSLEDQGATGSSKMETWDNVKNLRDEAGKATRTARDAIKAESDKYAGIEDPTVVRAEPILEQLKNMTDELKGSARSGIKQLGRFWNETFESLSKKADANDGVLTLEDVHSELQDVGKDLEAGQGTARYRAAKDIYHHLIDVQDQMASDIAQNAKNPALRDNLLNANKKYSQLSRVMSDVTNQAEKSAVGADTVLSGQRPLRAGMRAAEPFLGRTLLKLGNLQAKYGPILKSAAAKGTQNLLMTDYILKQSDPNYAKATQ